MAKAGWRLEAVGSRSTSSRSCQAMAKKERIALRPAYHCSHGGIVYVASSLRRATNPSRSLLSQARRYRSRSSRSVVFGAAATVKHADWDTWRNRNLEQIERAGHHELLNWMVLAGAAGGMFPVTLTMIGLRARSPETTGALSAFVQAIGYIAAGTGPLLVGVFLSVSGGWALPLGLLYVALAVGFLAGWRVSRPSYVDDELAVATR